MGGVEVREKSQKSGHHRKLAEIWGADTQNGKGAFVGRNVGKMWSWHGEKYNWRSSEATSVSQLAKNVLIACALGRSD